MSKESRFRRAQAVVLTAVRHNGPLSSETLTAMCINNGLIDISQAGAIFQTLRAKGLIEPWSKFKRSNRKAYGTMWSAPNHYPVLKFDWCKFQSDYFDRYLSDSVI